MSLALPLALVSLLATPAPSPPVVVLLTQRTCCPGEAWIDAEQELVAELGTLGTRVLEQASTARTDRDRRRELETAARGLRAASAVRILRVDGGTSGGVEIWIYDGHTGKIMVRRYPAGAPETGGASVIALRVVELLRVSLLEITPRPARPARTAPGTDREVPAPLRPERLPTARRRSRPPARWAIRVGFGVLGGPGRMGVLGAVQAAVTASPHPHLAVELQGEATVVGGELGAGTDTAVFGVAALRAVARWEVRHRGVLRPSLGVGVGALFAWARGQSTQARALRDQATVADLTVTAQLALALHPRFWIRLAVLGGVAVPEVNVVFLDGTRFGFGRPYVGSSFGLETRF